MKIPSAVYGALGGAVVASMVWIAATPTPQPQASPNEAVDPERSRGSGIHPQPISSLGASDHAPASSDTVKWSADVRADQKAIHSPPTRQIPTRTEPEREPTRSELYVRAAVVEEQANAQLESLAQRLNLTEEQQDRIFPLLASASHAFHPSLRPEGAPPAATTTTGGGSTTSSADPIYGDGSTIQPGAPIAEVENAIHPELDEVQQASLEEEAMDREAWWEDVVAMLEEDLESSTSTTTTEVASNEADAGGESASEAAATVSEEERQAAGQTEQIGGFSNLFGN